jgi:outer membrane protein OmpA-like peptidoglycan-associated protein
MSKKTTYFIGILATLIIGFLLHFYFCCDKHCVEKKRVEKTKQTYVNAVTPFKFEDGHIAIRSNDNFNFYFSGHAIMQPISEDLLSCINEMIRHLEKNKNKTLNISGLYNEREENLSNFDNLGLARSKSIKRVLIEQGLDAAQVSTTSEKDNSLTPNQEGVLNGPYAFSVEVLEGSNSLEAMKASIMEDPVLLNFAPERYQTDLNAKQRKKLETLAAYLNASDDTRCTIVGHADSVKSEQLNLILGKNRAEFTKTMLLKYGVDPIKIKTTSKGETQPIASNTTAKGKAQNRRTEVIIN